MSRRLFLAAFLRRICAAGGVALVLALAMFAASPELHGWLHHDSAASCDDACPVVLFSSGVSLPLGAVVVAPPAPDWHTQRHAVADEVLLVSPRYLRQPERGPPVG